MLKEDWQALAKRLSYANEKEMFVDLYKTRGISVIELGKRLGFTRGTIARRLGLLGIIKRSRGGANNQYTQRIRLWRIDQRLLYCFNRNEVARVAKVSLATLQSFVSSCASITWPKEKT